MPFTICREAPLNAAVYPDEDARLIAPELLKREIPLDRVPRLPAPQGQNGWLYVWESRADAENAAKQLKRRTGDRWLVRETDQQPSLGQLLWLRVNMTAESDALLFVLDDVARRMIEQRFPGSCRHRSVLVGTEPGDDLLKDQPHFLAVARQALFMLAWVPLNELAVFGKFQVIEPWGRGVVLPPSPIMPDDAIEIRPGTVEHAPPKAMHGIRPTVADQEGTDWPAPTTILPGGSPDAGLVLPRRGLPPVER
ncbi:MAG TPA: hypothetical protein VF278_10305 [Pirellulales bacterium]